MITPFPLKSATRFSGVKSNSVNSFLADIDTVYCNELSRPVTFNVFEYCVYNIWKEKLYLCRIIHTYRVTDMHTLMNKYTYTVYTSTY